MPAPRLLDKRLVNAELATQRKQQVDLGVVLSKKVDAVRESLDTEEARLEEFRSSTIKRVQVEIDAKIRERETLESDNIRLREERIRLSGPLDLVEAWDEVNSGKQENTAWNERLTRESIEVLAREEDARVSGEKLRKELETAQEKAELAERTLQEAERRFAHADDASKRALEEEERVGKESKQRENHLAVREEDATLREISLSKREVEVEQKSIDLENREQKLRVAQETFMKAQNYLSNRRI